MPLDLAPFGRAVERLREGLARHRRESSDEQLRDGLIQRFEFTYDLSHRMLRRYLREIAGSPDDVAQASFAELIRRGSEQGLLRSELPAWRRFREIRNRTSHTYDEQTAADVVAAIPDFLAEAEHLLSALQQCIEDDDIG